MKILLLTNKLPYPPKDGGSIATLNMITGFRDSGHDVCCLSLNTVKHNFPLENIPASLTDRIRFIGVHCDSSIRPVRMLYNLLFSKTPYIAERFNKPAFREKLIHLLGEEEFDIVQLEGPYLGHYIDVIHRNSKARISFRAHNVEHRIWERKAANEKRPLRRWYFYNMAARLKNFEKQVAEKSSCLVCISPLDEKTFREMGLRKPIITIPTGLDLQEYPESDLPQESSVFFIGALDWLPNQEGLTWFMDHVLDDLRKELPELAFHVAGRNASPSFEVFLSGKKVIYHGEIEDAKEFMQAHRIMIAPLFTGSGIRIKILEALALGRPVITTSIGVEGIPAGNMKELLISDDAESFKNQIIKLVRDDVLASELVSAGRKLIRENFDTFGLSTQITRFFKEQV